MEESGYILHEDCDNIKRYVFFKNLKETGLIEDNICKTEGFI